jgi:pyruvate formate lyase activating enzyme
MHKAVLYEKLKSNLVRCKACSFRCTIADGTTGICGIRLNKKGKLFLTVYGQAVGMHLDPVEKKPLNHFLPGSKALSFGTVGCDFGCAFCQNWIQSQPPRKIRKEKISPEKKLSLLKRAINEQSKKWLPEEIVAYAIKTGAESIAYTYNEPTIFIEYAFDTAKLAHKYGIKNIFVSNGFESKQSLDYIAPYLDAINVDLKSFNPKFYEVLVQGKLKPVLKNLKRIYKKGIHLEITTLIIPTKNDSKKELKSIASFIQSISPDIPWHVSAFHPDYRLRDVPPTPIDKLHESWEIGKKVGLHYIYTGNIPDVKHTSTYCPKCNELLIRRIGYLTKIVSLDTQKSICKKCKTKITGVWKT